MAYKLVRDGISRDTIEALEQLLEGARQGEITGIAFACVLRRQRFLTNVAGSCYKNPTFTRGIVGFLSDELASLVHGIDENDTR